MKRIGTFVIAVALVVGMVGCGEVSDNGNGTVSYQLTVSSTSGGSVVAPGEGVHVYEEGTVVELEAVADDGYRFVNWTGGVGTVVDVEAAATTITMDGDYSVTASFVAVYDLSISSTAGGSVTTPGEGTFTYEEGAVVDLVATPSIGYRLGGWTGDVSTVADVNAALTTITINGDYSITANFEEEEPVYFADANLEAVIREAIGKPTGVIYPSHLKGLTWLHANNRNISDLTGLEHCVDLSGIDLYHNHISDLSPLANLKKLSWLYVHNSQISDLSPLANLTSLTGLDLNLNQISDITPLANLTNLRRLDIGQNRISDISPLANLTNLTNLDLWGNKISDISPLATLTKLTSLGLVATGLVDISFLANFTSLTWLHLGSNQISDVSSLEGLSNLEWLYLGWNEVSDISPLVDNVGLGVGDEVWLRDNPLSDESINEYIPALQARGVTVDY